MQLLPSYYVHYNNEFLGSLPVSVACLFQPTWPLLCKEAVKEHFGTQLCFAISCTKDQGEIDFLIKCRYYIETGNKIGLAWKFSPNSISGEANAT